MDLSIIIVNWNTSSILKDCLESLFKQTYGISFEVIVVDNGSSDDSVLMVKNIFNSVILIQNRENRGFAAANNQGIRIAQGRYILFLNSDTIVLNGAIQRTLKYADLHDDIGVVGCRVLNSDGTLQPTCFMYPSALNLLIATTYLNKLFPKSRLFGREKMTWWDRSSVRDVDVVTGCFMLVRTEIVKLIGGFDEKYFLYGEETDFCFRAANIGKKLSFTPDAEIIHLGGGSSRHMKADMILQGRASLLLFIRQHKSLAEYLLSCFLLSMNSAIRVPYYCVRYLFSKDKKECLVRINAYSIGTFKALRGWEALKYK